MNAVATVFAPDAMLDPASHLVSEESIRERAYAIYERRGRLDGRAEEDWYEAEVELRNELQSQQQSCT